LVSERVAAIYRKLHELTERVVRAGHKSRQFRRDVPARELAAMQRCPAKRCLLSAENDVGSVF
jgi:hypothetical protein